MKDYKLSQLITSAALDGVDGELALHELKVVNFNHIDYHQQNQDSFYATLQTFLTLPVFAWCDKKPLILSALSKNNTLPIELQFFIVNGGDECVINLLNNKTLKLEVLILIYRRYNKLFDRWLSSANLEPSKFNRANTFNLGTHVKTFFTFTLEITGKCTDKHTVAIYGMKDRRRIYL